MGKKSRRNNNSNTLKDKKGNNKKAAPTPNRNSSPAKVASSKANVAGNDGEGVQIALVQNLKERIDLNDQFVTIKTRLPNGRVVVEVTRFEGTVHEFKETVSIKAENLVLMHDDVDDLVKAGGEQLEICPICMDTPMVVMRDSNTASAVVVSCCMKCLCYKCLMNMKSNGQTRCPFCNYSCSWKGSKEVEAVERVSKFRERANRGDPAAMFLMGQLYLFGDFGLQQDFSMARTWFEKAARLGDPPSANNLGVMLFDGKGGPVDHEEAAKWFRVASDLGQLNATTILAQMYIYGHGVPKDYDEAKKLLKKSIVAGDEAAKEIFQLLPTIMFEDMLKISG